METPITSLSLVILIVLYLYLSFNVINFRRTNKISLGDQSNAEMLRKIRMHANFTEYVPIGVILIFLMEFNLVNEWFTLVCAIMLILSRFLHPYSLSVNNKFGILRPISMGLTFTSYLFCIFGILVL